MKFLYFLPIAAGALATTIALYISSKNNEKFFLKYRPWIDSTLSDEEIKNYFAAEIKNLFKSKDNFVNVTKGNGRNIWTIDSKSVKMLKRKLLPYLGNTYRTLPKEIYKFTKVSQELDKPSFSFT